MTFSTRFSRVSAVAALTLSLSACLLNDTNAAGAADAKDGKLVTADVQKKLLVNFPNAKVVSISPTPLAGLFEVVLNKKDIVYVDREARSRGPVRVDLSSALWAAADVVKAADDFVTALWTAIGERQPAEKYV